MKKLEGGDYVLATKYSDGCPRDHFCVGFFRDMTNHSTPRFNIVDENGNLFRGNGFRRCDKISKEVGDRLVEGISVIEEGYASVWYWRYHPKQLKAIVDTF